MGLRLCRCFQRNAAKIPSCSIRSFLLVKALYHWSSVNLACSNFSLCLDSLRISLLSTKTGSLLMFSSLALLRSISVMLLLSFSLISVNLWLSLSMLIQNYKIGIFQNAHTLDKYLRSCLTSGLNVTYITHKLLDCTYISCLVGIGLILRTTLKGYTTTRSINALSLSSFSNRIMHIGSRSSLSSLGLIGLKVALVNQWWNEYLSHQHKGLTQVIKKILIFSKA